VGSAVRFGVDRRAAIRTEDDVSRDRAWSIAAVIFVVQFVVVALVVLVVAVVTAAGSERDARVAALSRTAAVAEVMARSGRAIDALAGTTSGPALTAYLHDLANVTKVDWISVSAPDGERLAASGPDAPATPARDVGKAVGGTEVSQSFTGVTGEAARTVAPVRSGDEVVGVIDVAVDLDTIQASLASRLTWVWLIGLGALVLIGAGAAATSIYLRRVTRGRGAAELTRMFQFYDSGLKTITDGVVLLDLRGEVVLMNQAARRMLGIADAVELSAPTPLDSLDVPPDLIAMLASPASRSAEPLVSADLVLLVDVSPVTDPNRGDRRIGTIVTLRDHTTLLELAGDVDSTRTLADALASQTHEFANRLHTIIALMELDRTDEAIAFASAEVETSQSLAERMLDDADDPLLAALLLGKSAQAHERGIRFDFVVDGDIPRGIPLRELVTIVGNLIDNAFDAAVVAEQPAVRVEVRRDAALEIAVSDSGPGPDPGQLDGLFELGATTKRDGTRRRGIGLALVRQSVRSLGGTIDVDGSTFRVVLPLHPAEERVE
jgi:two-component system, CitB family, sensor kinase